MTKELVSVRTCVGCHTVRSQKEMTRFVRNFFGSVLEDFYNNKKGRGAYICTDTKERCLIQAIRQNSFDRALPRETKV